MRRIVTAAVALGLAAAVAALAGTAGSHRRHLRTSAAGACGTLPLASTHYRHVVWIWMENHSYGEVIGSPDAPYLNSLAANCGVATNYHNVTHPSLPNYIAATSGLALSALARFHPDCAPSRRCSADAPSIFAQAPSWRAYEESMPSNCDRHNGGEYAVRHNPPPYYMSLSGCSEDDVPYSRLASDSAEGKLPAFAFITPNLQDDMHDGSVAQGDAWVEAHLPALLSSRAYAVGEVAVFITWDEGEGGSSDQCATNTSDVGCHVPAIVISASTARATRSATLFNHYSMLRTAEQLLGLPALGEAASAHSMLAAFDL